MIWTRGGAQLRDPLILVLSLISSARLPLRTATAPVPGNWKRGEGKVQDELHDGVFLVVTHVVCPDLLQGAAEAQPSTPRLSGRKPAPPELQHQLLGQTLCTASWETTQESHNLDRCVDLYVLMCFSYFLRESLGVSVVSPPQSEMKTQNYDDIQEFCPHQM